jgi:hypothetical protein
MSKAGRKRNSMAKRQPDGSIRSYEDPMAQTVAMRISKRLNDDAKHEWFGFPLGVMMATKVITAEEFAAGKRWTTLMWRLAQIDGLMLPKCKAIDWSGTHGRALAADPTEDELGEFSKLRISVAKLNASITSVTPSAMGIMRRLCLADEQLGFAERVIAKMALAKMAASRQKKGS